MRHSWPLGGVLAQRLQAMAATQHNCFAGLQTALHDSLDALLGAIEIVRPRAVRAALQVMPRAAKAVLQVSSLPVI